MSSPPSMKAKIKKTLWFVVKLGIAVGIVAVLFGRNHKEILESFRGFNFFWLIPAMALYALHIWICTWRWWKLTRVLNLSISRAEALSLTMQAYFFSLVLPGGAIGGDVVKIGVLAKRASSGTKLEAAFTILMDRIVGMIALFSMALVLIPVAIPTLLKISLPGIELTDTMRWMMILGLMGLCAAGLGASMVIFFHKPLKKIPPVRWLMELGDRLSRDAITRMTTATDHYSRAWKTTLGMTLLGIPGVHLMVTVSFGCLLMGLGVETPGILAVVVAMTIANIIGLIPLFPGGLGGRDLTCVTILSAAGMAIGPAKAGQLLYTALIIAFNLSGALFFLLDPGRRQTRELLEKTE